MSRSGEALVTARVSLQQSVPIHLVHQTDWRSPSFNLPKEVVVASILILYMTGIQNLSVAQIREILAIRQKIEALEVELSAIANGRSTENFSKASVNETVAAKIKKRRKMSAAGRSRIAAAAKARWAKAKAAGKNRL